MNDPNDDLIGVTIQVGDMEYRVIGPASWSDDQYVLLQGPVDQILRPAAVVRRRKELDNE